ncbi:ATP synthase F1 subunit epsilon [Mucilaginibacter terrenus]|uniref:ATP synthase F1 subunit epsilon n=1 Tax=Mucilaginibacter terrenus TaxID=2482727 RepID=A0A3E2NMY8_9SPHI|nr:ATP synthase F1 subunit epsilon [Mucilaginibacter terrenus]RFZ82260.1 ATP synthase F1 subunit epsilon [Mucilaginibacter terrenus]
MTLEILTPDKKVFEGEAASVVLPGALGSFEILDNHAPIISTLNDGKLTIRTKTKQEDIFFIKGGVVEAVNNKVTVLAEGITHK